MDKVKLEKYNIITGETELLAICNRPETQNIMESFWHSTNQLENNPWILQITNINA